MPHHEHGTTLGGTASDTEFRSSVGKVPALRNNDDWNIMCNYLRENNDYFSNLEPGIAKELCKNLRRDQFEIGAIVIKEGDVADGFFILHKGLLGVRCEDEMLGQLMPGTGFGELGLLDAVEPVRKATIMAERDSMVFFIPRADYQQWFGREDAEEMAAKIEYMENHKEFSEVPKHRMVGLGSQLKCVVFTDKSAVVQESCTSDYVYFIMRGQCIETHSRTKEKDKLMKLNFKSVIGQDEVVRDIPYQTTVCSIGEATTLQMKKEDYMWMNSLSELRKVEGDTEDELGKLRGSDSTSAHYRLSQLMPMLEGPSKIGQSVALGSLLERDFALKSNQVMFFDVKAADALLKILNSRRLLEASDEAKTAQQKLFISCLYLLQNACAHYLVRVQVINYGNLLFLLEKLNDDNYAVVELSANLFRHLLDDVRGNSIIRSLGGVHLIVSALQRWSAKLIKQNDIRDTTEATWVTMDKKHATMGFTVTDKSGVHTNKYSAEYYLAGDGGAGSTSGERALSVVTSILEMMCKVANNDKNRMMLRNDALVQTIAQMLVDGDPLGGGGQYNLWKRNVLLATIQLIRKMIIDTELHQYFLETTVIVRGSSRQGIVQQLLGFCRKEYDWGEPGVKTESVGLIYDLLALSTPRFKPPPRRRPGEDKHNDIDDGDMKSLIQEQLDAQARRTLHGAANRPALSYFNSSIHPEINIGFIVNDVACTSEEMCKVALRNKALGAVGMLAEEPHLVDELNKLSAVETFLSKLDVSAEVGRGLIDDDLDDEQTGVAGALWSMLFTSERSRSAFAAAGGVKIVMSILHRSPCTPLVANCTGLLWASLRDPTNALQASTKQHLSIIWSVLKQKLKEAKAQKGKALSAQELHDNDKVKANAVGVLATVTEHQDTRIRILHCFMNPISLLLELLDPAVENQGPAGASTRKRAEVEAGPCKEVIANTCACIGNITKPIKEEFSDEIDSSIVAVMSEQKVVQLLVKLCHTDHDIVRKQVAYAVAQVVRFHHNRQAFAELGGIVPLVSFLRSVWDAEVLRNTVIAMMQLSLHPTCALILKNLHVVEDLTRFIGSTDEHLAWAAASTLGNIRERCSLVGFTAHTLTLGPSVGRSCTVHLFPSPGRTGSPRTARSSSPPSRNHSALSTTRATTPSLASSVSASSVHIYSKERPPAFSHPKEANPEHIPHVPRSHWMQDNITMMGGRKQRPQSASPARQHAKRIIRLTNLHSSFQKRASNSHLAEDSIVSVSDPLVTSPPASSKRMNLNAMAVKIKTAVSMMRTEVQLGVKPDDAEVSVNHVVPKAKVEQVVHKRRPQSAIQVRRDRGKSIRSQIFGEVGSHGQTLHSSIHELDSLFQ